MQKKEVFFGSLISNRAAPNKVGDMLKARGITTASTTHRAKGKKNTFKFDWQ
jgi:hypothetical protein